MKLSKGSSGIGRVFVGSVFLALAFLLAGVVSAEMAPEDSSATSADGSSKLSIEIPDSVSLTLSKPVVELNVATTPSGAFSSDYTVVNVSTSNYTGYTLNFSDEDSDNKLNRIKVSELDDDATISTIDATNNPSYNPTTGITSGDMRANAWGYSVGSIDNTGAEPSYTENNYFAVPVLANAKNIKVTDTTSANDLVPVFFGAKLDNSTAAGTYQDTVVFTVVANYTPSGSNTITNIAPSVIATSGNDTLVIDTNIDYSENLVDSTHPLNVYLVKVGSTPETTVSCTGVTLVNNSDKLRITCTTPATGLEPDVDYTVRLTFTKLGDLAYNSNDTIAGQGFWNITYMQDMSPAICNALYTPSTAIGTTTYITDKTTYNSTVTGNNQPYIPQRTLIDKRDNHPYYIKKLADGNCWMDQNLDLDLGTPSTTANSTNTTMTLTNELTDLNTKTSWTPPYNTQLSTGTAWAQNSSDGAKSFTFNDNGTVSVKTGGTDGRYWNGASSFATTGDARNHFGNYYNWPAATAGSGTASITTDGQNVGDSICPKGWQLPQNSGTKSFNNLIRTVYGISATNTDASVIAEPLHFIRSGDYYWNGGTLDSQGTGGLFWSATAKSDTYAYNLAFYSGDLVPQDGGSKGFGFTVRCVAR